MDRITLFRTTPRIVMGPGAIGQIGDEIREMKAKKVLLVTDKGIVEAGLINSSNDLYEVTEKGQTFLERFDDFSSRYSKLERQLEEIAFEREVLERMCELVASGGKDPRGRRRKR